jgi:hypothetical protein
MSHVSSLRTEEALPPCLISRARSALALPLVTQSRVCMSCTAVQPGGLCRRPQRFRFCHTCVLDACESCWTLCHVGHYVAKEETVGLLAVLAPPPSLGADRVLNVVTRSAKTTTVIVEQTVRVQQAACDWQSTT